jgi:hypothetical protein
LFNVPLPLHFLFFTNASALLLAFFGDLHKASLSSYIIHHEPKKDADPTATKDTEMRYSNAFEAIVPFLFG